MTANFESRSAQPRPPIHSPKIHLWIPSVLGKPGQGIPRWLIVGLTGILLMVGLSLWHSPLRAQSIQSLEQQQQQLQQQLRTNQEAIQQLQQQESTARQQMGQIRTSITSTNTRIADNEYRLQQAQRSLEQAQQQLEEMEVNLRRQQAGTAARLRYLQRQGSERWWALLLSSRDLNEFFDRRHQLHLLIEADRALISQMQETTRQIDQQRIALERQRNEIALIIQELAAQRNQLQEQAVAHEQMIGRITGQRSAYEAAQQRLEADTQRLTGLIQQLIAQQTQSSGGGDPAQGTGRLVRPVGGPVTSGFGWRIHPVYGTRRLHAGIDFGVATGTPVQAADTGTVIFAGWYGGYGNTVIINHGGGITTLYAHNSRLSVGQGQQVQRGQVVAGSGSTGLSTGPHVHFEVRVNGQPVDPARYL